MIVAEMEQDVYMDIIGKNKMRTYFKKAKQTKFTKECKKLGADYFETHNVMYKRKKVEVKSAVWISPFKVNECLGICLRENTNKEIIPFLFILEQ